MKSRDSKHKYRTCVPPNKYKETVKHVFTSRRRTGDTEWIVYCGWCGQKEFSHENTAKR